MYTENKKSLLTNEEFDTFLHTLLSAARRDEIAILFENGSFTITKQSTESNVLDEHTELEMWKLLLDKLYTKSIIFKNIADNNHSITKSIASSAGELYAEILNGGSINSIYSEESGKITLTDMQIELLNSLLVDENINFFLVSSSDIGLNKALIIKDEKTEQGFSRFDRWKIERLFNKFDGGNRNDVSNLSIRDYIANTAVCSVSIDITNQFPDDKVNKYILLEILKTRINSSQQNVLIQKDKINSINTKENAKNEIDKLNSDPLDELNIIFLSICEKIRTQHFVISFQNDAISIIDRGYIKDAKHIKNTKKMESLLNAIYKNDENLIPKLYENGYVNELNGMHFLGRNVIAYDEKYKLKGIFFTKKTILPILKDAFKKYEKSFNEIKNYLEERGQTQSIFKNILDTIIRESKDIDHLQSLLSFLEKESNSDFKSKPILDKISKFLAKSFNFCPPVILNNQEIILLNSLLRNKDINFFLYCNGDMYPDKGFAVAHNKKNLDFIKQHEISQFFSKFHGNNRNHTGNCSVDRAPLGAARCSVGKSITNEFPDNKVDKSRLFEILKTMIDPAQHEELIKESEIDSFAEDIGTNDSFTCEPKTQQTFTSSEERDRTTLLKKD